MKDFEKNDYANHYIKDMSLKLPGYFLMFDLLFKGVLPVEINKEISAILSIGGGEIEVNELQQLFPNAACTLLDSSDKMLEQVKASLSDENGNIDYVHQAFEEYQTDAKFQLIFSLLVIHFIENKEAFLTKIFQLLDREGICIISAFSNQHVEWWKEYALNNGANKEEVMRTFSSQSDVMNSVEPNQIEASARKAGFTSIEKIAQILSIDLWLLKK